MELDITFFALAVPAVLFAGISKGGFGGGAAFAATPFLALAMEPAQAVGLMLPLLMLMDVSALKPYWKKWSWPNAKMLILGGVPGVLSGAALYKAADPDFFRVLIGLVAVGFVLFQFARGQGWIAVREKPFSSAAAGFWGILTGFTSFISHAGGPPASIQLLSQNLSKTSYQATTVVTFWAINALKFIPYFLLGFFTVQTAIADLVLAPVAFIGVMIGVYAHRLVPETLFFKVTYVFLLVTGSKLIFDGLT